MLLHVLRKVGFLQYHFVTKVTKGRVTVPKRMNFWEKWKRPWTAPPPPHFRKILLQFLQDRIIILYLGVRLATVGADVSLNMFRIAMLGDVLQKGGLVREALVAGVALVRLVALVAPRVGLQVGQLGERLRATWRERK